MQKLEWGGCRWLLCWLLCLNFQLALGSDQLNFLGSVILTRLIDHLAMLVKYLSDHLALIDGILAEHLAMLVTSDS